ncbi:MAG: cation:proton antiporter [Mariprofundales bacterium]
MPLAETVLVLMGLLAVAMVAASLAKELPIPFTVILVGIGMVLGGLSHVWQPLHLLEQFRLSPDLVLFVFLPALIFESGYNLNARQLLKDMLPVLTMAVPALLLSTAIVGLGLWLLFGMEPAVALLFGALISATDPVAVIALFKELGAPLRLTVLVEGESLFNDATAIVVFNILLAMALAGGLQGDALLGSGFEFLYVFLGGTLAGLAFGFVFSEWMRLLRSTPSGILVLSVVLAYVSFTVAEHFLHVSGVMAVVGAALCLGVYGITRIPHHASVALRETWELIAFVCNSLLFLLVGLSVNVVSLAEHLPYIIAAIILVVLARLPAVYFMLPAMLRLFRLPQVRQGDKLIMWWGGLKGGLAIAIVLSIPEQLPYRQLLLDMTLGVVVFTLLVHAPTIRPLIHKLGFDRLTDDEQAELQQGLNHAKRYAQEILLRMQQTGLMSRATYQRSTNHVARALEGDVRLAAEGQQRHQLYRVAMRAEVEALEQLKDAGMVPQYVLMDIKSEMRCEREAIAGETGKPTPGQGRQNPLLRMERAIIGRVREHDWLIGWLVRYQMMRLSQLLRRNVVRILMAEAALAELGQREDLSGELRQEVEGAYRLRLETLNRQVVEVRREFPDFFTRFESWLGIQVSLASAQRQSANDFDHGETGSKAYAMIDQRIAHALEEVPTIGRAVPELSGQELIQMVPLFSSLSAVPIDALAKQARMITFLSGDTVIAEGSHGDALYIISRGCVEVSRGQGAQRVVLAELHEGDFFGEMALLGDRVRKATVVAVQSVTLLRLSRIKVLALSKQYPEVARQLRQTEAIRQAELSTV